MTAPASFADRGLGIDETITHTTTPRELQDACDAMVAQARFNIRILTHDTEPALYNRDDFVDRLATFISSRRKVARIRILVEDPRPALLVTHRLVALWHRFPSFVELRELTGEYARNREAFLLVDDIGLIRRPDHELPAAVVTFRNLATAIDRARWFDEAFERGAASRALRRLSL